MTEHFDPSIFNSYDEVCREVRRRWGSATPFRVGRLVGETGITFAPPPDKSEHWLDLYERGAGVGAAWRDGRPAP